ncbi:MAG TPA: hypothetical protein VKM93_01420 [Terriglobia bacterium]|nr:hypothetical protein [Terriglobia bacterium]
MTILLGEARLVFLGPGGKIHTPKGGHNATELDEKSALRELVLEAVRVGADFIEMEYKDGYEEICFMKGGPEFGSGSGSLLKSSSERAKALRKELWALKRKKARVTVGGVQYRLSVSTYDSFGETAFRARLQPI